MRNRRGKPVIQPRILVLSGNDLGTLLAFVNEYKDLSPATKVYDAHTFNEMVWALDFLLSDILSTSMGVGVLWVRYEFDKATERHVLAYAQGCLVEFNYFE